MDGTEPIIYSWPYVPAEWIAAHGLAPRRVTPDGSNANAPVLVGAGVCSYAAAFANLAIGSEGAAGIVLSTTCDQMRRMAAPIEARTPCPVFLFHVPAAVDSPNAMNSYCAELVRLGRFLERVGGGHPAPDALIDIMTRFDAQRTDVRAGRGRLSAREYSAFVIASQEGNRPVSKAADVSTNAQIGVPLALVGSPLRKTDLRLFDSIERAGGTVVLDATATGERSLPRSFDADAMRRDPLRELASAYYGFIPDAFQRPNTRLYDWLRGACASRSVRGIVAVHYVWCDIWQAEAHYLREWAEVPVLVVDIAEDDRTHARVDSRIEAFLESLR